MENGASRPPTPRRHLHGPGLYRGAPCHLLPPPGPQVGYGRGVRSAAPGVTCCQPRHLRHLFTIPGKPDPESPLSPWPPMPSVPQEGSEGLADPLQEHGEWTLIQRELDKPCWPHQNPARRPSCLDSGTGGRSAGTTRTRGSGDQVEESQQVGLGGHSTSTPGASAWVIGASFSQMLTFCRPRAGCGQKTQGPGRTRRWGSHGSPRWPGPSRVAPGRAAVPRTWSHPGFLLWCLLSQDRVWKVEAWSPWQRGDIAPPRAGAPDRICPSSPA